MIKNISISDQYISDSQKTLSEQDEAQRTIKDELLLDALDAAFSGNTSDMLKRQVFYKDDNAHERYSNQAKDITKIASDIVRADTKERVLSQKDTDLLHAALGISSESGEITEAIIKHLVGQSDLDNVNIKEEVGDVLWYLAILCRRCGFTLDEAMNTNIEKLAARYPNKFNCEDAINRDLDGERCVLESE